MSVPLIRLEVPDYDLGLRGKTMRSEKVTGSASLAFCTIVHGLSVTDEVTDTPTSNADNGYPDAQVAIDEDTRIELPWLAGEVSAVIGDLIDAEGRPIPASARGQVAQLVTRYADLDLQPVLGFEYELWLSDARTGEPLGSTENAYSLDRLHETHALAAEFVNRMEHIGAPVEAFHSELGPGFFEFALKPQPALRAADGAARARQYLRDLAREHGLRASFMAKPYADKSGAGGHVHSSLGRAGANVFATAPGELSDVAETYLAGLLDTMSDLTLLFNPFVNSYKRLNKEMFVAETATWGSDDRSVSLRVLLDSVTGARVEHRRPGADASPYLVAAGLLAGGLVGLEQGLTLPPAGHAGAPTPLPGDLADAVERFEGSRHAKDLLGEEFVQGYAATRRNEGARYQQWLRTTITDWELRRYGGHL
jgi:glutamine synthetase